MTLKDRVVLVTGAARGLGRATALRLAADGAHVVLNDLDAAGLEETARLVTTGGRRAVVALGDVADAQGAAQLVEKAVSTFGTVDVLVNNAGILRDATLAKMTEADFDAVIRVNLKGVFQCTKAVLPVFRAKAGGRSAIVNISSISYLGNVGQTNYAAAKAGVVGMTATWALELARYGVRVNAVAPGLMDTDMVRGMPEDIRTKLAAQIPLGRIGRPDEVAAVVAFLASEESSYMTGQVLHLCGGASVGGFQGQTGNVRDGFGSVVNDHVPW